MLEKSTKEIDDAGRAQPFPQGVRVLLPDEVSRRREIESSLLEPIEAASYREVVLPVLDFAECYRDLKLRSRQRETYRLVDRNGELLALRADFTPIVARALGPKLNLLGSPLRVFYRGDVVRCAGPKLGGSRESFEIGAELVGGEVEGSDLEIVELAVRSVASRVDEIIVSLGDASVARVADDDPSFRLSGLSDLDEGWAETRERLEKLVEKVESLGARAVVSFGGEDTESYYTGVRFRIYGGGDSTPIVEGGRYDDLYGAFGFDSPAVGFTINVDALEARR